MTGDAWRADGDIVQTEFNEKIAIVMNGEATGRTRLIAAAPALKRSLATLVACLNEDVLFDPSPTDQSEIDRIRYVEEARNDAEELLDYLRQ